MLKRILIFSLPIIFLLSLIGCNKESFNEGIIISKEDIQSHIKSADMLYDLVSSKADADVIKAYDTTKELYRLQNDISYKDNYIYKNALTLEESSAIISCHGLIQGELNYNALNNFKTVLHNKENYTAENQVILYLAENYYKNTDFSEYTQIMKRSSNDAFLNESKQQFKNLPEDIRKELDKINNDSLFNIEISMWEKKDIKNIMPYLDMYMDFNHLISRNISLKEEIDKLSMELLDPNSSNYGNVSYMIKKTAEILDSYKLDIEEYDGFKNLAIDIITLGIDERITKSFDIGKTVGKIVKGEFDLGDYAQEQISSKLSPAIKAPFYIAGSIGNFLNNHFTNEELAAQFSIAYIFGNDINTSNIIDVTDIVEADVTDIHKINLIDNIGNALNTELNGTIGIATNEQVQDLFKLVNELKGL